MNLIKRIFLEEYKRVYGIPVFYGNEYNYDIQYNQFICEKVGITSKEKRNYIINPVGALVHLYIKHLKTNNTYLSNNASSNTGRLYKLLGKILQFNFVEGRNRIRVMFYGLPKLTYWNKTSKFCIVVNQNGHEEIVESSTWSKCKKFYGCSLSMTPVIREENIASNEHILELLSIILSVDLNKPIQNSSLTRRRIIENRLRLNTHQEFLPEQVTSSRIVRNNVSLYNSQQPERLLEPTKYMDTLRKLYREASILTSNRRKYNPDDISKIKRLLQIIEKIRSIKIKRLNFNDNLYQQLRKRLYNIYNPDNNSPQ